MPKNKLVKTKIIPDTIVEKLEKLDFSHADHFWVIHTALANRTQEINQIKVGYHITQPLHLITFSMEYQY